MMPMYAEPADVLRQIVECVDIAIESTNVDLSLCDGLAGIALFYSAVREHRHDLIDTALVEGLVERIQQEVALHGDFAPGLWNGLTGIAFAVERVAIALGASPREAASINEDVDEWLLDSLDTAATARHHDLVIGLSGMGMYALSRSDERARQRLFSAIFRRLMDISWSSGGYRSWISRPPFLAPFLQRDYPSGCHDVGLAHGNPGVLAMLTLAIRTGLDAPGLAEATQGLANWLLDQQRDGDDGAFGFVAGDAARGREAWCYGDPGVALALMRGGLNVRDRRLYERGLATGIRAAQRATGAGNHAGICHGHAGLSILYRQMHALHAHPAFIAATANAETHIARLVRDSVTGHPPPAPGLWNGLAGMGLALVGATGTSLPAWLPFIAL